MIPFEISFRDIPESDAVFDAAAKRIEKLERFFGHILRCEVVISCPHRHRQFGRLHHVLIHVFLPGEDVVINRNSPNEAHRDVFVAIRDVFDAAERMLEDKARISRHEVKVHEPNYEEGTVAKVFYDRGFGFLLSHDDREIYFSENCILNEKFEHIHPGEKVKFVEELGENGPQATSMVVNKTHHP